MSISWFFRDLNAVQLFCGFFVVIRKSHSGGVSLSAYLNVHLTVSRFFCVSVYETSPLDLTQWIDRLRRLFLLGVVMYICNGKVFYRGPKRLRVLVLIKRLQRGPQSQRVHSSWLNTRVRLQLLAPTPVKWSPLCLCDHAWRSSAVHKAAASVWNKLQRSVQFFWATELHGNLCSFLGAITPMQFVRLCFCEGRDNQRELKTLEWRHTQLRYLPAVKSQLSCSICPF